MTTDKSVQPDTVGQEAMVAPLPTQVDVLGKLLEAVQGLTSRMERLESTAPQFVPSISPDMDKPKLETYVPPEALRRGDIRSLTQDGQTVSRTVGPLENARTLKNIPPAYRPFFRSGDLVRINPDATVWGSKGRKWRDVLAKTESEGVGQVMSVQLLTSTFEPKYTVFVKGLTQRNGDGYRESELLRA